MNLQIGFGFLMFAAVATVATIAFLRVNDTRDKLKTAGVSGF